MGVSRDGRGTEASDRTGGKGSFVIAIVPALSRGTPIKAKVTPTTFSATESHGFFFHHLLVFCFLCGVPFPLHPLPCYEPGAHFNRRQQLSLYHLASHPAKRRPRRPGAWRLRPPHPHPPLLLRPFSPLVRPDLGSHRMHLHQRQVLLRHRRLRRPPRMQRLRWRRSATLAQFTLHHGQNDFSSYAVSLVDGFNLPMTVTPHEGKGLCPVVGCRANLLETCPGKLQMWSPPEHGKVVACKSGCEAFGTDELCCRNHYNSPQTCRASSFSEFFKHACPATFTYAHDSPSLMHECSSPRELKVIFCH
ncbi:Osmotin-like protein [Vitis vinifera]|uniref:Osmotin-like protein n=1 Tax=Vitis vinifera TaxID=29760 RepID=A0A438G1Q7_VITVI|nr:Osmotin-like protein [Vitis vinifera]